VHELREYERLQLTIEVVGISDPAASDYAWLESSSAHGGQAHSGRYPFLSRGIFDGGPTGIHKF
jgi:hypothetical protein